MVTNERGRSSVEIMSWECWRSFRGLNPDLPSLPKKNFPLIRGLVLIWGLGDVLSRRTSVAGCSSHLFC